MVIEQHQAEAPRVEILGIPVDRVTMDEALERIDGFVADGGPHLVVTADSSGIVAAQTDAFFRVLLL